MKFNEALSLNKDLRKQIDNLRQERSTFDGIYKMMEKTLADRKKAMSAIIEASNKAYEDRDSAQREIASIQQAMSREKQEFEETIVALNRCVPARGTRFMLLSVPLQLPLLLLLLLLFLWSSSTAFCTVGG